MTAPLTFQNILALPRDVAEDPLRLASKLACDGEGLNPAFAELSSLVCELQPAGATRKGAYTQPATPSATETEPTGSPLVLPAKTCPALPLPHRRARTTFAVHEQAVLYAAFCEDSSICHERLVALAGVLSRDFREIRGWWYNKRSDVRDTGRVRIPAAVQRAMRAQLK